MKYLAKKIFTLIITLFIISLLAFLAFQVIPGDPASQMLGVDATPEQLAALRESMGLNRPVLVRYWDWLSGFLTGDMGTSYTYNMPVQDMILSKLPITATLAMMSFLLTVVCSIPLGIWQARHNGKIYQRIAYIINQLCMAIPSFFLGILFTLVFGLMLKFFTVGDFISYTVSIPGFLRYLIFPAIAIALPKTAMTVKLLRSSILSEWESDYIRTAYSRGNSTGSVLYGHVLRNALIPVVTFLAMTLPDIVAGSIVIEQVFAIPGIGRLLLSSVNNRDFPVVLAIVLMIAFLVVFVNFLVDVLYQWIDPRIRIE